MKFAHALPFGATLQDDGNTQFRIWAPSAPTLDLVIGGVTGGVAKPMQAQDGGWHALTCLAPAGTQYQYRLPNGLLVPDPASRQQATDVHDPSVVVDPNAYEWQHGYWAGRPWHETVIYEAHPGLMGGFSGMRARLPELIALGITVLELMPIADFPGTRNWGYDGVLPFAPDTAYGTPDELKALIDAAHGHGMSVMLDVVYNHFGPDGAYIHALAKPFFNEAKQSLWGAAIDFKRTEVRDYFAQNSLYWLQEYRFDGFRYDAVQAISEEDFLPEMVGRLRQASPGRYVHLVMEHDNNRSRLLRGPGPHFDAQWADDWHHAMHVLLTGETEGYYEDFEDATALMARALAEGFAYQGEHSRHANRPRGESAAKLEPSSFVTFLQNHDQTGNRALGERKTMLTSPDKLEAATALLLLSPMIPLLFMGEEDGSTSPFLYFTDHHGELAELVRAGRRREFRHFRAFSDESVRDQIPDPNDVTTFERSMPNRANPAMRAQITQLLALRREHVTPGIPGARSLGAAVVGDRAIRAAWRLGTHKTLTIMIDLSDVPSPMPHDDALFSTPRITVRMSA